MNRHKKNYWRLYIYIVATICSVLMIASLYNGYILSKNESLFFSSLVDYSEITHVEKEIYSQNIVQQQNIIENAITFFKKSVPSLKPDEVSGPQKLQNNNCQDYLYKINFTSVSRKQLAYYLFYTKKAAASLNALLKVKNIKMEKSKNFSDFVDIWKVNLTFIQRKR